MSDSELRTWLDTLRYHLRRGPVIVNKYTLRRAVSTFKTGDPAIDTEDACRILTQKMLPKVVHFVPLEDCARVILV